MVRTMKDTTFERALLALDQTRLYETMAAVVSMYREYVDTHGHDPDAASASAIMEVLGGTRAIIELDDAGEL